MLKYAIDQVRLTSSAYNWVISILISFVFSKQLHVDCLQEIQC